MYCTIGRRKIVDIAVLALDEKSTFDFFALFLHMKRASLYMRK
jgi:hypothetical protein